MQDTPFVKKLTKKISTTIELKLRNEFRKTLLKVCLFNTFFLLMNYLAVALILINNPYEYGISVVAHIVILTFLMFIFVAYGLIIAGKSPTKK